MTLPCLASVESGELARGFRGEYGERARHGLAGDRKFSRLGDFMPGVGFPRSPQDTRKTQDTPIPAALGKTLTDYWQHMASDELGEQ